MKRKQNIYVPLYTFYKEGKDLCVHFGKQNRK